MNDKDGDWIPEDEENLRYHIGYTFTEIVRSIFMGVVLIIGIISSLICKIPSVIIPLVLFLVLDLIAVYSYYTYYKKLVCGL